MLTNRLPPTLTQQGVSGNPMPSPIEVIIHALSGAGGTEEVGARLGEIFRARGIEAHISLARTGDEIAEFARRQANSGGAHPE